MAPRGPLLRSRPGGNRGPNCGPYLQLAITPLAQLLHWLYMFQLPVEVPGTRYRLTHPSSTLNCNLHTFPVTVFGATTIDQRGASRSLPRAQASPAAAVT